MVPAAELFDRSIDSVMLVMHNYKNKTYKKRDIYTSFTCKTWGPLPHLGTDFCVEPPLSCNQVGVPRYILYFFHTA